MSSARGGFAAGGEDRLSIHMKKKGFAAIKRGNKGFTLVELIAVIVVIVILAAIALPRIGDMQNAAGQAQVKASTATLNEAVQRAIVEGTISSTNVAGDVSGLLLSVSPVTAVPYANSNDLINVTFTGTFPAFTAVVPQLNYQSANQVTP